MGEGTQSGLYPLAGYPLDEWMRTFIAGTRDFQSMHLTLAGMPMGDPALLHASLLLDGYQVRQDFESTLLAQRGLLKSCTISPHHLVNQGRMATIGKVKAATDA